MFSEIAAIRAGNATRKGTTMTSGPRPPAHDAEETPRSSDESLEEFTERTAEVMDDARKQVNRARATFHDQIVSSGVGIDDVDYARHEPEPDSEPESKDDQA